MTSINSDELRLRAGTPLKLEGSTSGEVTLAAPAVVVTPHTFTLPAGPPSGPAELILTDAGGVATYQPTSILQNTDTALDEGNPNEVTAADLRAHLDAAGGVFGTEFETAADETQSTTSSNPFLSKLLFTTASKPIGTYLVTWSLQCGNSTVQKNAESQILVDGVEVSLVDTGAENSSYEANGGFYVLTTVSAATHTIEVKYRRSGGGTARIKFVRLAIWRLF